MSYPTPWPSAFVAIAIVAAASSTLAAPVQVDVEAAKNVFKENDCRKCHDPLKAKAGPSLKKIAEKYKGKADGEQKVLRQMTQGPRIKLDDGKEEDHKILDTKDPKVLKNVAQWILSQ
ncbi:MAG: c-type cytochrome [Sulfuritalea sp.]|jgi:cytochrome c|nr:c-type cytochrome [Sulfuritalea sp.]